MSDLIEVTRREQVSLVRFGDDKRLNPLDEATLTGLRDTILDIGANEDVRVLVLAGNGHSFSAGGDLAAVRHMQVRDDVDSGQRMQLVDERVRLFWAVNQALEDVDAITMAAVNGAAYGGGLELLMACDLAVAASGAKFGDGHINLALIPGSGGTQRLPRLVGLRRALYLALSGKGVDAETAREWGLVTHVFDDDVFWDHVWDFASDFTRHSPRAVRTIRRLQSRWSELGLDAGLEEEHLEAVAGLLAPDALELVERFLNKKKS